MISLNEFLVKGEIKSQLFDVLNNYFKLGMKNNIFSCYNFNINADNETDFYALSISLNNSNDEFMQFYFDGFGICTVINEDGDLKYKKSNETEAKNLINNVANNIWLYIAYNKSYDKNIDLYSIAEKHNCNESLISLNKDRIERVLKGNVQNIISVIKELNSKL